LRVRLDLLRRCDQRRDAIELAVGEPESGGHAVTQPIGRSDDGVEYRLQAFEVRERAQHVADGALLLAQLLQLAREFGVLRHEAGSSGAIVRPSPLSCSQ
jgi:hypothetical protein